MAHQTIWHETRRGPVFARHWGDPALPKILMLHGFPEYSGAWEELATRLSHQFHCVAPDQRGYGQTGGPADVAAYRLPELVQDMAEVIGTDPVTVLGHDWGASVAYGLAIFAPALVQRLIILNGVHPAPFQHAMAAGGAQSAASQYINHLRKEGSEDRLAENNFEKLLRLFSADMDLDWMTPEKQADYLAEWARPGRLKTMIHWYRASPLRVADPGRPLADLPRMDPERLKVRCPHLLIWGRDDTALLPESTVGLEEFANDLTRVELDDADHWLAHQQPDVVSRAILDWIA